MRHVTHGARYSAVTIQRLFILLRAPEIPPLPPIVLFPCDPNTSHPLLCPRSTAPPASSLPQERGIFIRETSENAYRKSSYVVAAGLMYVPLQLAMAAAITLESWWCVGLTGGVEAMLFFFLTAFLCLFAGNALATFFSALLHK